MKIGLYFLLYGSTSSDATNTDLEQAFSDLVVSMGKISTFIYQDLRSKPGLRAGGQASKVELIKDHLDQRVQNVEGRIKHALKLCGPGAENDKQKDVDPINISRAGMGLPANFGPRPQHIAGDRMPTPGGQTYADNLIGGGFFYGSEHGIGYGGSRSDDIGLGLSDRHGMSSLGGFGAGLFGNEGVGLPLQGWDPLSAGSFDSSYRRRRSAKNELRKKIKKMNRTFVPLENFISENLSNCKQPRIDRLQGKVDRMKQRVEKVVKRQEANEANRS